jgi:hypothetical protein
VEIFLELLPRLQPILPVEQGEGYEPDDQQVDNWIIEEEKKCLVREKVGLKKTKTKTNLIF